MSSALRDATGVLDQALTGGALAGSGALLLSLAKLVAELRGSKEQVGKLVDRLEAVQPQLVRMVQNDEIKVSKQKLEEYEALLSRVRELLQEHVNSHWLQRVLNHWKMKECVIQFHVDLNGIKDSLGLANMEEDAQRHREVLERFNQRHQVAEQSAKDMSAELRDIKRRLSTRPKEMFAELGRTKDVVMADFMHEIQTNFRNYSKEHRDLLREIMCDILREVKSLASRPSQPEWYLPRGEFRFEETSPFSTGKFRSIYHGLLVFSGAAVTIRTVDVEENDTEAREKFEKEVLKWTKLRDPHVLPLYGANHRESPMVFVCGRAELGNFNDYLKTNKHRFWQVFVDVARGLAYLHMKQICHANLKCNNLLVTKHGVGVVSDFEFSFLRINSVLSLKEQTPDFFWKAPECFAPPIQHQQSSGRNPRFASDVYSLGMCIYEAQTGTAPYAEMDKEVAIDKIRNGELPPRPSGSIDDAVWSLINKMCCHDWQDRIGILSVIDEMGDFADKEKHASRRVPCGCSTEACFTCGGRRHFETPHSVP